MTDLSITRILGEDVETVAGVPLGFSRDYDHLPLVAPLRRMACRRCLGSYEDGERQSGTSRVLAMVCPLCQEESRARWIAEQQVKLPRAVARIRRSA